MAPGVVEALMIIKTLSGLVAAAMEENRDLTPEEMDAVGLRRKTSMGGLQDELARREVAEGGD